MLLWLCAMALCLASVIPYAVPGALALLGCWWLYSHSKEQARAGAEAAAAAEEAQQRGGTEEESSPQGEACVPQELPLSAAEECPGTDLQDVSAATAEPSTAEGDTAGAETGGCAEESGVPAAVSVPGQSTVSQQRCSQPRTGLRLRRRRRAAPAAPAAPAARVGAGQELSSAQSAPGEAATGAEEAQEERGLEEESRPEAAAAVPAGCCALPLPESAVSQHTAARRFAGGWMPAGSEVEHAPGFSATHMDLEDTDSLQGQTVSRQNRRRKKKSNVLVWEIEVPKGDSEPANEGFSV
ncbi:A-kinase anchor protein 1, mitochondrial-like [Colius striatus]|uniref:A-kinase anchor protein 1, mitochondrial-like n=1 Tax=Colius striatus TaxID=57412 RepID=UPI002B1D0AF8|nr:A-kinase anchor protein 1, mitochondrial-like [Colius striatus]